jgi:peptidoglycan/LPS O-acetylase OafA/YrhL
VAGPEEGNSMGIGYCAESYVDFGPIGMFLPVFLLGVYYGLIYRSFVIHSVRKIFAFSIVASLMFSCAFALETTNSILLGRVAVYSLAMAFFIACLGGQIWDFLTASPQRKLARKSPGHQVV